MISHWKVLTYKEEEMLVSCVILLAGGVVGRLTPMEEELMSIPKSEILRDHMYNLTRRDHVMGSAGDWENARMVKAVLESSGAFDEVRIESIPVMLNAPVDAPSLKTDDWRASLSEDLLDSTSDNYWRNHTFNAYGASGFVEAPIVYANYGMPSDFETLEKLGVSVAGAIVLTRYGGCFRGLKAMNAEARGAVATLIYSDPEDDGFTKGPVYPDGPWRPESAVQRGSAQYLSLCAGDPFRLYLERSPCGTNVSYLPTKPVLPLSYGDAREIFRRLGGPSAPREFVGGLEKGDYRLGPSNQTFALETKNEYERGKIPNVIATIKGKTNRTVLAGNHRDAWVYGAVDPHSGTVSLLEAARSFGHLRRRQSDNEWRPIRTIVFCSWSGEEYGLIGSTAFTELNDLRNAVAYVNLDVAVSGNRTLEATGTQSLDMLFDQAVRDVEAPVSWTAYASPEGKAAIDGVSKLGTMGSGSDYTAFIDNLGIPSLDFSITGDYGVYHSVYDSFEWIDTFGDPGFKMHRTCAQLFALLIYRLADSQILPIDPTTEALAIAAYIGEFDDDSVDLSALRQASLDFDRAAECAAIAKMANVVDEKSIDRLNDILAFTERQFIHEEGLPDRPWYKHVLQAPAYYLGYGAASFPGVAHAIEDGDFGQAQIQTDLAASKITQAAAYLSQLCSYSSS